MKKSPRAGDFLFAENWIVVKKIVRLNRITGEQSLYDTEKEENRWRIHLTGRK